MEAWEFVLLAVFVALPLVLLPGFHGHRERLTARGAPLPRDWRPAAEHRPSEDAHH